MSHSHAVVIVDPGIKNENGYAPYDQGLQNNSFIKVRGAHKSGLINTLFCGIWLLKECLDS